jgi:hypothetical protein
MLLWRVRPTLDPDVDDDALGATLVECATVAVVCTVTRGALVDDKTELLDVDVAKADETLKVDVAVA